MKTLNHALAGTAPGHFARIAFEYMAAGDRRSRWVWVPYIIGVGDPGGDRQVRGLLDLNGPFTPEGLGYHRSDLYRARKNMAIETHERLKEVLGALYAFGGAVLPETITPLGWTGHRYWVGAQIRPEELEILRLHPQMRNCSILTAATLHADAVHVMRRRIPAMPRHMAA